LIDRYGTKASKDALFPFIYFSNLNDIKAKGFTIKGVYQGELSSSSTITGTNYYDENLHPDFAYLKYGTNELNYIPDNTSSIYTVVVEYNCPAECSPFINCGINQQIPACLSDSKLLEMKYGWNCSNYPTINDVNESCYLTNNGIKINVITNPVSIGNIISLNDNQPLKSCSTVSYDVQLKSCQPGSIDNLKYIVNFPSGLTYLSHTGNFTIEQVSSTQLILQIVEDDDLSFNSGGSDEHSFQISFAISCDRALDGQHIVATISGETYCGSISEIVTTPINLESINVASLDPVVLNSVDYNITRDQLIIDYELTGPASHYNEFKVTLADGIREVGTGKNSLVIPITETVAGSYTATINIEGVNPICSGTYTSNVILSREYREVCSEKVCTIMISEQAVPASFTVAPHEVTLAGQEAGCENEQVTLTATVVPQGTYSYRWYSDNIEIPNETGSTLDIYVTTTAEYKVEVLDIKGCVVSATRLVRLRSKIECCTLSVDLGEDLSICSGQNLTLTVPVTGVTYLWSPGGETSQSIIVSPTTTTVYSVHVTDGVCTASDEITVTVDLSPEVTVIGHAEYCIGKDYTLTALASSGTPGYSYLWFRDGVAIPSATQSVYNFTASATSGGNYSVLVTDSKGCSKESEYIIVEPKNCCTYALGDATAVCGEESIICVPLQAIRNVPHGIIGMDFCMEYNPNFVTPTGNATLGNVVVDGAVENSNGKFFLNTDTQGFVRVTISYDYSQPNAASSYFKGTGNVICIEFKSISTQAGTVLNNIFRSCQLDEAYTLIEKPGCLEKNGSLSYIENMDAKGSVIYHSPISFTGDHILKYSGVNSDNRYPLIGGGNGYLETNIQGITGNCADPQGPIANTDIEGNFEIDASNFTSIKVSRDIKGEYGSSDCEPVLSYLNGMDAYYMEHITTLKLFSVHDNRNFIPSAYQMIAADVNMNGKVRANDVTLLQERAVLKICEFPQVWNYTVGTDPDLQPQPGKKSIDWRFFSFSNNIPSDEYFTPATYPKTSGDITYWRDNVPGGLVGPGMIPNCINLNSSGDQNCLRFLNTTIHAVLLGDVDRNWVTKYNTPGSPYLRTTSFAGKISFKLNEAYLVDEAVYRVPVQVESDSGIVAIDFDMDYNEDQIEIRSVNKKQLAIDADARLMYNDYNLKRLFVTSYSMTGFGTSGTPYYIDIYSKDGVIEKEDLGTIKGYINGDDARIEVITGVTTVEHPEYLVGVEVSVVPNPASGITKIIYNAGNNSEVNSLLITDAVGKVVREFHNLNATGEVEFDVSDLSAGMYYCNFRGKSGMKLVTKLTIVK
ncbi:MAG TPA: T9SS type A sorting domain-containing protein, partial [Cytophagaceae bacterium]